jgi:nucleoside-diphosphate-sugar epimerase
MTILVTGAGGFVGCHIVEALARAFPGELLVAVDAAPPDAVATRLFGAIGERCLAVPLDVTDREAVATVVSAYRPTLVVHAAAITPTPEQERANPIRIMDVNLGGLAGVLDAAGRTPGVRRVLSISSTGVFGPGVGIDGPVDETVDPRPSHLYGVSKRAGEDLLRRWCELTGVSGASFRLGTIFGRHERPTPHRGRQSAVANLVAAGRGGRVAVLHGAAVVRDWLDGDDLGDAVARVAAAPSLAHPVYNLVGERRSFGDIAAMAAAAGIASRWVDDPAAADVALLASDVRAEASTARFVAEFGPVARAPLADAIRRFAAAPAGEAAA